MGYAGICLLCFLTIPCVSSSRGRQGQYSNEWLLHADLNPEEIRSLALNYGLEYSHEVLPGFYVLKFSDMKPSSDVPFTLPHRGKRIVDESKVRSLRQQRYLNRERRDKLTPTEINITDQSWNDMWYFHPDRVPSMKVYETWELGYTGAEIQIAVLDDGLDIGHPDLVDNYRQNLSLSNPFNLHSQLSDYSYDYLYDNNYPIHNDGDFHGTWCAGIISAVKNDECIVGVAYGSKFAAVKTMDSFFSLTPSGEAMALLHELQQFDIYSISWGPSDDGRTFEAPDDVVNAAFHKGVTEGRNGMGVIYTWAAGNGGQRHDNCNCDGYVSSIYTIAITSISMDLAAAWYSERCTSILAGTYGGDYPNPGVSTTATNGRCTDGFEGTSATCPIATGIIALVLEANPELTWRDVQHLIVETSSHEYLNHSTSTSGAGRQVNDFFGFGLMQTMAMVNRSLSWKTVPDQIICRSENITVNGLSINGSIITSKHSSDGCSQSVRYLEHVQARVVFQTIKRGALEIFLTAPSGLSSQLLTARPNDRDRQTLDWTFMTVHHWGEDPSGEWQLRIQTTETDIIFSVSEWQLVLYGTSQDPAFGRTTAAKTVYGDSSYTAAVVGGTVGGVAFLAVAIAAILILNHYKSVMKVTDNVNIKSENKTNSHEDWSVDTNYRNRFQ